MPVDIEPIIAKPKSSLYKQPWFIAVAVLIILWFGIPLLLKLINPAPTNNLTETINLPVANVPLSLIETTDDPVKGSPIAPVVIVEFSDFQCPFCRESKPIIAEIIKQNPEAVKLIYRDFPVLTLHTEAVVAAEAANCAQKQGAFWGYHDSLFDNQESLGSELYLALAQSMNLNIEQFTNCLDNHLTLAEIQKDLSDGVAAGVTGTPTWFVNGRMVAGALTQESWQKIINSVIKEEFAGKK